MRWLMWLVILVFLGGCADSSTKGNITEREYDQKITVNNHAAGYVNIYFPVYAASDTDSVTRQETAGTSTISPDTVFNLADKASMIASEAAELKDAISKLDASSVIKDSQNPVTTTTKVIPAVIPPKTDEEDDTDIEDEEEKPEVIPFPLEGVKWLHTDVSGWTQTGTLRSVSTTSSSIKLDYDKAKKWPAKDVRGKLLNANPWIFVKQDGVWYAATFEWLRPGQTTKGKKTVAGDHIKKSPLDNFKPKKGETYGFMVSGLARDKHRNTEERTNVIMFKWK